MPMKIVTIEEMRQLEQACAGIGIPTSMLMENAGKAVAEETKRILGVLKEQRIVVLIGPGNNGGDGLVAARYLHDWGAKVSVVLFAGRPENDQNLKLVKEQGITCLQLAENRDGLDDVLATATAVIDALFGTGKSRPLTGIYANGLQKVSEAKKQRPQLRIIALDLPSGLNADTGAVDPACLYADETVTLGFAKPGLFNPPGAERAGRITVVDIGIPFQLAAKVMRELLTAEWAGSILPKRSITANKGSFGRVLVVAGSINYIGAAYLACSGAMRTGAGLVTLATAASLQPILAAKLTEATYLPLPESSPGVISEEATRLIFQEHHRYDALLVGCGLGQNPSVVRFVKSMLIEREPALPPLVLDADALNIIAGIPDWWRWLADDAILTPHPGEMARLMGVSIEEVQSDRSGAAVKAATMWHKTVVLKGAYTVIATPDGRLRVSPFANPGLASAGTGDVLSGIIAGLVGQGVPLADAAAGGVYLHGQAGEMVRSELGDTGMLASDLLPVLPRVIRGLKDAISG
ncbi:MAG: NAD(P)H-hydrate dehydratase [Chloroflexota bacterium]|nr:NAD(P)H-hydrate dehydratase [Chloroflexota bacterium]